MPFNPAPRYTSWHCPSTPPLVTGNRDEQSRDDAPDQHAPSACGPRITPTIIQPRPESSRESSSSQWPPGDDIDAKCRTWFSCSFHDAFDGPELTPHLLHHETGCLTDGFHAKSAENEGAACLPGKSPTRTDGLERSKLLALRTLWPLHERTLQEDHCRETGRTDRIPFCHGF